MKTSSPRLIDIAEKAGVSVTSVSRILGGQRLSEYSEKTLKHVRGIANEMGWRPNLVVRGMKTGQTHTFGVFMAPYDTFWTGVLYGIHDTLLEAKQVPLVLWPHALVHPTLEPDLDAIEGADRRAFATRSTMRDAATADDSPNPLDETQGRRHELDRINCLEDRRVDAIISWPLHEADARDRLTMLSARGWRIVTIDDELPAPAKTIYVGSDEVATMKMIKTHLMDELGHRQIGYLGVDRDHAWAKRRKAAFREVWSDPPTHPMIDLSVDDESCHDEVVGFITKNPQITAIVAATDHIARQATRALIRVGKKVPGDLSIMGYGNDAFGSGDVALTTIDQQPYEVGKTAAGIALNTIKPKHREILISGKLISRASTQQRKP